MGQVLIIGIVAGSGYGLIALGLVLVYQWVIGRRAYRAGVTGDLSEFDAGARQIVSA